MLLLLLLLWQRRKWEAWSPSVTLCSALEQTRIGDVWTQVRGRVGLGGRQWVRGKGGRARGRADETRSSSKGRMIKIVGKDAEDVARAPGGGAAADRVCGV